MPETAVIIVAAGRGRRFGSETPKQYLRLAGQPLIRHTVSAFAAHPDVTLVQPVIDPGDADLVAAALEGLDYLAPVAGGETRQQSVAKGLAAVGAHRPERVLVHDAARPFVPADLISRVLAALQTHDGAIPGLRVVDTLKRAADGMISETVPRDDLWRAQTPQGFHFETLLAAHAVAAGGSFTDDAAVMEAAGHAVAVVEGDERNIKVTAPADLIRVENIMLERTATPFRIGKGFDVHKLGPGDGVRLCGVLIPSEMSLVGHSDADVALHAVTDAILGAVADGDIGSHFPPSDPQWKGASSDRFLDHACALARRAGYEIDNIDLTVICERPKVGPHRDAMRRRLAEIVGVEVAAVSVKATTTEGLGFTGRGEGIAADAVVLLGGHAESETR